MNIVCLAVVWLPERVLWTGKFVRVFFKRFLTHWKNLRHVSSNRSVKLIFKLLLVPNLTKKILEISAGHKTTFLKLFSQSELWSNFYCSKIRAHVSYIFFRNLLKNTRINFSVHRTRSGSQITTKHTILIKLAEIFN